MDVDVKQRHVAPTSLTPRDIVATTQAASPPPAVIRPIERGLSAIEEGKMAVRCEWPNRKMHMSTPISNATECFLAAIPSP